MDLHEVEVVVVEGTIGTHLVGARGAADDLVGWAAAAHLDAQIGAHLWPELVAGGGLLLQEMAQAGIVAHHGPHHALLLLLVHGVRRHLLLHLLALLAGNSDLHWHSLRLDHVHLLLLLLLLLLQ